MRNSLDSICAIAPGRQPELRYILPMYSADKIVPVDASRTRSYLLSCRVCLDVHILHVLSESYSKSRQNLLVLLRPTIVMSSVRLFQRPIYMTVVRKYGSCQIVMAEDIGASMKPHTLD